MSSDKNPTVDKGEKEQVTTSGSSIVVQPSSRQNKSRDSESWKKFKFTFLERLMGYDRR